jgi:hypothetical protein
MPASNERPLVEVIADLKARIRKATGVGATLTRNPLALVKEYGDLQIAILDIIEGLAVGYGVALNQHAAVGEQLRLAVIELQDHLGIAEGEREPDRSHLTLMGGHEETIRRAMKQEAEQWPVGESVGKR